MGGILVFLTSCASLLLAQQPLSKKVVQNSKVMSTISSKMVADYNFCQAYRDVLKSVNIEYDRMLLFFTANTGITPAYEKQNTPSY